MATSSGATEPFVFTGIGESKLRAAFARAGHRSVDLASVHAARHENRRNTRTLRSIPARKVSRAAGISGTTAFETLAERPTVFVLGEMPQAINSRYTKLAAELVARMQPGDLLLIERQPRPGDCARIVETVRAERADLCADDRRGVLVNIALCPPPTNATPDRTRIDQLIGGYTPQASQRAKAALEAIHDGHLFTSDAQTIEQLANTPQATGQPLSVSVVMPAFNAREYIKDSVNSVLSQNLGNLGDLELIVVDDGSDDGTPDVLEALAKEDARLRVLRAEHNGPGIARNRGLELARGRYLAFADADDRVLPGSYFALVSSLERTGSEMATGTYVRTGATGRIRPRLSERVHAGNRTFNTVAESPNLLEEPVLWNKVFSRGLWQRAVHAIPDVLNYEDQEPVFRALLNARGIDVLTRDVYEWRLPDGRETRSRGQHRHRNIRARKAVIGTLETLIQDQPENVKAHAYAAWVGRDLMIHAENVPSARKRSFRSLSSIINGLIRRMPKSTWNLIAAQDRFLALAVASGRLEDVEEILGTRAEESTIIPLENCDGRWVCRPTYLSRLKRSVPERLTRAMPVDFTVRSALRSIEWTSPDHATLTGYAYIQGIDPTLCEVKLIGLIESHEILHTPTKRATDYLAAQDSNDPWHDIAPAGFTASLQLPDVRPGQRISIHARVTAPGVTVDGRLDMLLANAPAPIDFDVTDNNGITNLPGHEYRWVLKKTARKHARFEAVPRAADSLVITEAGVDDASVWFRTPSNASGKVIAKGRTDAVEFRRVSVGSGGTVFSAPLPQLPEHLNNSGERFMPILHRRSENNANSPVIASATLATNSTTTAVRFSSDESGQARIAQRKTRVSLVCAELTSDDAPELLLHGRVDPPDYGLRVALKSSTRHLSADINVRKDGTFTANVPLVVSGQEGASVSVPSGGYFLQYATSTESSGWVKPATATVPYTRVEDTNWNTLRLEVRPGNLFAITISAPLNAFERTRYGQFQLRKRSWGTVSGGVVFESFNGKGSAGNARAILDALVAERPHGPYWWSIRDRGTEVPPGAQPLVMGTSEWHSTMATASVWVNDNNFPYYVQKRNDQHYLQTWHGTPLKKLLWDLPRRRVPLTYRRLMRRQVPQWDLLFAETEEAGRNLRTSLGYEGDLLIGPYPRNDRLNAEEAVLDSVRTRTGITQVKPLVLYAPTWRNEHRAGQPMAWSQHMDLARIAEHLDCQFIVRAHHITSTQNLPEDRVTDVSIEPHVEYLMDISDVLITDYSSVLFDYSRTGKPIIRHIPDADAYDRERGVYSLSENPADYTSKNDQELIAALELAIRANRHRSPTHTPTTTQRAVEIVIDCLRAADLRPSSH